MYSSTKQCLFTYLCLWMSQMAAFWMEKNSFVVELADGTCTGRRTLCSDSVVKTTRSASFGLTCISHELKMTLFARHFGRIPFTIQRLCELLTEPKRNYTGTDKFLRGVEKVRWRRRCLFPYFYLWTSLILVLFPPRTWWWSAVFTQPQSKWLLILEVLRELEYLD